MLLAIDAGNTNVVFALYAPHTGEGGFEGGSEGGSGGGSEGGSGGGSEGGSEGGSGGGSEGGSEGGSGGGSEGGSEGGAEGGFDGNPNNQYDSGANKKSGSGTAGTLIARWRIATNPSRTGDEYAVWLLQLLNFESVKPEQISQIIIASVVPRAVHNLTVLAEKYFKQTPLIAGQEGAEWGMAIDVDDPRSLGADRALNAIAGHAKYGEDLIIIDFGTATTFDAVDYNGAYKGGIIAPGINLSLDALVGKTAKLPRIAITSPDDESVLGLNTEDQMLIGVFWGYVAMMEGLTARMRAQIGRPAKIIATGGLALLFDKHTDIFDAVDSDLTLDGLAILAERNRAGSQE